MVVDHNPHLIARADWVIDLGPEGGNAGGQIIVEGPPEEVAEHTVSFTGHYLRTVLNIRAEREIK